jgi:hypothetical protein
MTGSAGRSAGDVHRVLPLLHRADLVGLQPPQRALPLLIHLLNLLLIAPQTTSSKDDNMSHFLDRLTHFSLPKETFSGDHGLTTGEDRTWEDAYRNRWAHDKIVRSTHGVNCTGSCSWKIYVKGGIVTWETQQTDYPRTRWDMPNHEPRGCARGASYSWYLYSANRVKYPMVRGRLLERWRAAMKTAKTPVDAWATIVEDDLRAVTTRRCAAWAASCAAAGTRSTRSSPRQRLHDQEARPRPRHRLQRRSRR